MKKYLLLLTVLFGSAFCANAQVSAKYHGEIDAGYSVGVGDFATNRVNLHTIQGFMIGNYLSVGVGFGLDYYHEFYTLGELFVPIFLNAKGYIPLTDKVSPFASIDFGYGLGATAGVIGTGGLLWGPSIGVKCNSLKFQVGYTSQQMTRKLVKIDMGAFQFKIGYVF